MAIDISLAANVIEKIFLVGVGVVATRLLERRTKLVAFYGHVGAFRLAATTPGAAAVPVHTHSVVIRNGGRLAAHNVRVPHRGELAGANIHLSVDGARHERHISEGQEEILFPLLAPRQQVTISYLYFPPLTWNVINLAVSSDEGMAKVLNVLPTPQLPKWLIVILWALIAIGIAALLYSLFELYRWAIGG